MKRLILLSMILVGVFYADWKRITGTSETAVPPDKKVLKSDSLGVYIRTTVFGFFEQDTTVDNKDFKRIEIPGEPVQQACEDTIAAGKPQIPHVRLLIAVPDSADFEISVNSYDYTLLEDYLIYPMPLVIFEDTADCFYQKEVYTYDTSFYQKDTLYPGGFCEIVNDGHWRDQRVLEVFLYPIQFIPAQKQVYLYTELDLRINYSGTIVENENGLGPFEEIGRATLLNYPGIEHEPESVPEPSVHYYTDLLDTNNVADYIIVTHEDFIADSSALDQIDQLAEWRVGHNKFDVGIVQMDDVYEQFGTSQDSAAGLRRFLVYAYNNWRARAMDDGHFGYCLFIGDWDYVPATYYWWSANHRFFCATEGYYRDIDSDSLNGLDDIMLGRWPVKATEVEDLITICEKTVDYEQNPDTGDWRRRGLLISGPHSGSDWRVSGAAVCFSDINYDTFMVRWSGFDTTYANPTPPFLDTIHLLLNRGEILAAWYGHGTFDYWTADPWTVGYNTTYAEALRNGDSLAVVLSYACMTASFQWDHPEYDTMPGVPDDSLRKCLGECFLFNQNGGAVAWFGGAAPLYMCYYSITPMIRILRCQNWILGQALINAIFPTSGHGKGSDYCLLGDPALDLGDYSAFPNLPDLVVRPRGVDISFPYPYPYFSSGDSIQIRTKVLNVGRTEVENVDVAVTVEMGPDDIFKDTVTVTEIEPRDSTIVTMYWHTGTTHPNYYGEIGDCDFIVEIDPDSEITESWEYNNTAEVSRKIALYPHEPGWPKKVVGFSQPALGNLDNAGSVEIVHVGCDSVYVFKANGNLYSGWPQFFNDVYAIALADLDCVGDMEIIAVSPESVTVYDDQGNTVSGWPQCIPDTSKRFYGFPSVGYISGSKKRQVIVYVGGKGGPDIRGPSNPPQAGMMVYDYDGDSLYYLTHDQMIVPTPYGSNGASISDVNDDGKNEIMVSYYKTPARSSFTEIFNRDGHIQTLEWGNRSATSALADLNDDGTADIIAGCADDSIRVYDAVSDSLLWARQTEGQINSSPAVGDIYPGLLYPGAEVTFGNNASRIHLREKAQGLPILPWPYYISPEAGVGVSPAIANIDGDTCLDVIIGASNNYIYAFTYARDEISPFPLPLFGQISSPIIGDIDGDKMSELTVVSSDGYLHVWENQASEVVPYTLEWPQFHHDYQRTGLYNWVSGMRGGDANPKEFSVATTLSFTLTDTLHIQISVYDVDANPVKTLVSQVLPNGTYHPIWDGKNNNYSLLPDGLYFIEIKVRNETKIIPVVLNR